MRSPADMEIVQIDITNACTHNCSNCTRFCGLHPKPFFMDAATFRRAVDSMAGFRGVVGIMGGEPTLHPDFAEFMEYYREKVPDTRPCVKERFPMSNFQDQVDRVKYRRGRHRGLWSSLGPGYYRHFELIQDVFHYQVLNDHRHVDLHQALLLPRRELGIPDEQWYPMRDRCWIQNLWSASITPKGAFFCEIAAALDMLLDGPGGWPIEPGWWRRKPEEFGDQLRWCELCSAALNVPSLPATEQTEIISPEMLERVKPLGGWKIRTGHYTVFERRDYDPDAAEHNYSPTWFLPDNDEGFRVSPTDDSLLPRRLDVCVLGGDERATVDEAAVRKLDFEDFLVVFPAPGDYDAGLVELLRRRILNPGMLYVIDGGIRVLDRRAAALRSRSTLDPAAPELGWPREKISRMTRREVEGGTLKMRLRQLWARAVARGAFLLPEK